MSSRRHDGPFAIARRILLHALRIVDVIEARMGTTGTAAPGLPMPVQTAATSAASVHLSRESVN